MKSWPYLRKLLFALDEETAHAAALGCLRVAPQFMFVKPKTNPVTLMGIDFPHQVGLAAGFDKNGTYIDALAKLGFAFIEIGTLTPKPQSGNDKPRLFRILQCDAIINSMGFNNIGIDAALENVKNARWRGIIGINIGKNRTTSLDDALSDYCYCLERAVPYASYITVNLSSPNTADLRKLQGQEYFADLMQGLFICRLQAMDKYKKQVPLLIKVSPDENEETLKNLVEIGIKYQIDGIIATNTTSSRAGVTHYPHGTRAGGLSGQPLFERATTTLELLRHLCGNDMVLIGVGGIDSAKTAAAKFAAGANLVQLYTGLIYQGPQLVSTVTGVKA